MKKIIYLYFLVSIFSLSMVLPSLIGAQPPEREIPVPGASDPFEVTLYEKEDYGTPIGTWRMPPGVRMLKIPNLNKIPLSISLGSKLGAIVFPDPNFSSSLRGISSYDKSFFNPGEKVNIQYYLIPFFRFVHSTPKMFTKYRPGSHCSLIIHRKDIHDFLGVLLESGNSAGYFYPLPEMARDTAVVYEKIPQGGSFVLSLVPGGTGQMSLYPSTSPPNPSNIDVTVTAPQGRTVKIPEPNTQKTRWNLEDYGIRGQISSITIRYKGPFNKEGYIGPTRHRAPPAPDAPKPPVSAGPGGETTGKIMATPPVRFTGPIKMIQTKALNVSGQWKSSIGAIYNITQDNDRFQWTVVNMNEKGEGTVNGNDIAASWSGQKGHGSAKGKITATSPDGRALKIDWNNGVRFFR